MRIIGAGMAGLLAANMLRRHKPIIYEKRPSLPSNHAAVLRFRTEGVSRATGIPFKKVRVNKAICAPDGEMITTPNLRYSNMYALKTLGRVLDRSILNLDVVDRWIAPADFINHMASSVDIRFGQEFWPNTEYCKEPIISTIPMPHLMNLLGWEKKPEFSSKSIWVITGTIIDPEVDVYQTIYYPETANPVYRASITGNQLIVEMVFTPDSTPEEILPMVAWDFGLGYPKFSDCSCSRQFFGKIGPIDQIARKQFIFAASERYHIYSLGRFATWRQILLDDLVQDVQFIEGFIAQRDLYSAAKTTIK